MSGLGKTVRSTMRRFLRTAALAACVAAACLAAPEPARAGFPFTEESWVDPCIVVCPAGDSSFTVFARRNGEWSGDPIWIDFCDCPGVVFAPTDGSEPYSVENCNVVRGFPVNLTPLFEFPLKAGGVCSGATITISLFIPDNFVRTAVASFDQNGDLYVDGADVAIAQGKLGTSDPTADFNWDGAVTSADLTIQQQHMGHGEPSTTAVDAASVRDLALSLPANPARNDVRVAFTLPDGSPARLELLDLSGRRIEAREVGSLGAGSHVATLAAGRRLTPGAYVVRLTQGPRTRSVLAVILR